MTRDRQALRDAEDRRLKADPDWRRSFPKQGSWLDPDKPEAYTVHPGDMP